MEEWIFFVVLIWAGQENLEVSLMVCGPFFAKHAIASEVNEGRSVSD